MNSGNNIDSDEEAFSSVSVTVSDDLETLDQADDILARDSLR